MPYYGYQCLKCGEQVEAYRGVYERHAGPACHCGSPTTLCLATNISIGIDTRKRARGLKAQGLVEAGSESLASIHSVFSQKAAEAEARADRELEQVVDGIVGDLGESGIFSSEPGPDPTGDAAVDPSWYTGRERQRLEEIGSTLKPEGFVGGGVDGTP